MKQIIKYILFILSLIIIFILLLIFYNYNYYDMTYIKSDIDNNYYLVRNKSNKYEASNMLGTIRLNIINLSDFLYNARDNDEYKDYVKYIDRLHDRVRDIVLVESTEDSLYTSYSVNKGEQIVFCLRTKKTGNYLHDINLIMYVVLHEISHVASPDYEPEYNNHGPIFKKVFAFITLEAIKFGCYTKVNFNENPTEYCGMTITDSII
jgi:hypothetical protein